MTDSLITLSDDQVERLGDWLDTLAIPNMGMNLEAMDGYMTAITLSPEPIPFEEWEPEIWGENAAAVDSSIRAQAQDLLLKHFQSVQQRVRYDAEEIPEELTPLMWLPEAEDFTDANVDEIEAGADWARGFFTGVGLRETEWDTWLDEADFVEEIFMYLDQLESGEIMNVQDPTGPGEPVDFKERMGIIATLPTMLHDLASFQAERNADKTIQ